MRLYTFTNFYLSSIQQGIQSLHVLGEMFIKYAPDVVRNDVGNDCVVADDRYYQLYDWASDHKTVICLNGGYSENLHELILQFADSENPFPWASFREGKDALDSALTSVGIILPARIYDGAATIRERGGVTWEDNYTVWESNFMQELNKYGLAK